MRASSRGFIVSLALAMLLFETSIGWAWKPSMHVRTAEDAAADALDDGQITIYKVNYEDGTPVMANGQPVEIGRFQADAEIVEALRTYPALFRAGVVGPDGFPDLLTGQRNIHLAADKWFKHVWNKANAIRDRDTRLRAKAFVVGFLTHGAGDMYGHTFINHYAGGPFDVGQNAVKHLVIEGWIAHNGPQPVNWSISVTGIEQFLIDVFLDGSRDGDLHGLLTEPGGHADGVWTVTSWLSRLKRGLNAQIAWYYDTKADYQRRIDNAPNILEELRWRAALAAFITAWGAVISYAERWVQDIDTAWSRYPTVMANVAQRLMMSPDGLTAENLRAAREELEVFLRDSLLPAFGAPHALGAVIALIQQLLALMNINIPIIEEIKRGLLQFLVQHATGMSLDDWKAAVSAQNFTGVLALAPHGKTPAQFKQDELGGANAWTYDNYRPAYNTLTMTKVLLLSPTGLRRLATSLGYPDGHVRTDNAMLPNAANSGFITTLDGDNRWHADTPRMVLAADFCLYKKMYKKQTGESAWATACPGPGPGGGGGASPEVRCCDGTDDDGDGDIDCADDDCGGSPDCGSVCGDGVCASDEGCESCATDCAPCAGCSHSACVEGAPLDDACDPCTAAVCAIDASCCSPFATWDATCVTLAEATCPDATCPAACGNRFCDDSEDLDSCPEDCGGAVPGGSCGDGVCAIMSGESPASCPGDCGGTCGDGACGAGEDAAGCPADCGRACGDGTCACDETCRDCADDCGTCGACGDGVCDDTFESCATCADDCGACPDCGDGLCAPGEDADSCAADCAGCGACGDGTCDDGETCASCAYDCGACATCGDGVCSGTETCASCSDDCGACADCGDGACSEGESCASCGADCGACVYCGDGVCSADEDAASCARDCDDGVCDECGDGVCEGLETCATCSADCGDCPCGGPCDDGDACNGEETCDEDTDTCQPGVALACDDGDACNGTETCDPSSGCQSGQGCSTRTGYHLVCAGANTVMPSWCPPSDSCGTMDACQANQLAACNANCPGGCTTVYDGPPTTCDCPLGCDDDPGCDGIPRSGTVRDACGVCGGDGSTCVGCDGIPGSGTVRDACGVCGGDGSTCACAPGCGRRTGYHLSCPTQGTVLPSWCPEEPTCGAMDACQANQLASCNANCPGGCVTVYDGPTSCCDCPATCGNGQCDAGEDCTTCAGDCCSAPVVCGDQVCDRGEDCASCAADCRVCGPRCDEVTEGRATSRVCTWSEWFAR